MIAFHSYDQPNPFVIIASPLFDCDIAKERDEEGKYIRIGGDGDGVGRLAAAVADGVVAVVGVVAVTGGDADGVRDGVVAVVDDVVAAGVVGVDTAPALVSPVVVVVVGPLPADSAITRANIASSSDICAARDSCIIYIITRPTKLGHISIIEICPPDVTIYLFKFPIGSG
jgi:hypothetical protein